MPINHFVNRTVEDEHQSLLHFIGEGKWADEEVLAKVREMVLPQERHGAIEAWIIDDTGLPSRVSIRLGCGNIAATLIVTRNEPTRPHRPT